jgi:pantetheine-phosphate adenylyltransferase
MKAIYALSADPITYGHIDVILRAASIFNEVIVAIGTNSDKTYMFTKETRVMLAAEALTRFPNIRVVAFEGLLVDYAYEQDIPVIIRGIRNASDYECEKRLALCGETQSQGIDTFLLMASPSMEHITSGTVKSIMKSGGYIHDMVPLNVKFELEKTLGKRIIIGVTGTIGAGKSYVTNQLVEAFNKEDRPAYNIDLDAIAHDILDSLDEPIYRKVRNDITHSFYNKVDGYKGSIDRAKLGEIVFNDPMKMQILNSIMIPAMLTRIKREIANKEGIFFINGALLIEAGWNKLCNNNIVLVGCDEQTQHERLADRGHDEEEIKKRVGAQLKFHEKHVQLRELIKQDSYGRIYLFDNSKDNNKADLANAVRAITTEILNPEDNKEFFSEVNNLL